MEKSGFENLNGFIFRRINKCKKVEREEIVELPLDESSVNKRTQDLRQIRRRSSLALRAKRASTFKKGVGIGFPHSSIPENQFYRHISGDLPEPVRLKQLLAWCMKRCMDQQESKYKDALEESKLIETRILNKLTENKVDISWYSRKRSEQELKIKKIKMNPFNEENLNKRIEYESMINLLKEEDKQWRELTNNQISKHALGVDKIDSMAMGINGPIIDPEKYSDEQVIEIENYKPKMDTSSIQNFLSNTIASELIPQHNEMLYRVGQKLGIDKRVLDEWNLDFIRRSASQRLLSDKDPMKILLALANS